jgi:hypothetical protein
MVVIMNNPPAFPSGYYAPENQGMSLRDYFAAKAMQRLLTDDEIDVSYATAVLSYRMADAMLKAREQ